MAPAAREVLFELLRDGPPAIRMKICQWGIKAAKMTTRPIAL
jgi:hypothetical protein